VLSKETEGISAHLSIGKMELLNHPTWDKVPLVDAINQYAKPSDSPAPPPKNRKKRSKSQPSSAIEAEISSSKQMLQDIRSPQLPPQPSFLRSPSAASVQSASTSNLQSPPPTHAEAHHHHPHPAESIPTYRLQADAQNLRIFLVLPDSSRLSIVDFDANQLFAALIPASTPNTPRGGIHIDPKKVPIFLSFFGIF
jgi:hypothetical protein